MIQAGIFDGIQKWFAELVMGMVGGVIKIIAQLYYTMAKFASAMITSFSSMSGDAWDTTWTFSETCSEAIAIVAFAMFLIYWLIGFGEKAMKDTFDLNELVKGLFMLAIGTVLVVESRSLLKSLAMFTDWSLEVVTEAITEGSSEEETTTYWDMACQIVGGGVGDYFDTTGCFDETNPTFMSKSPSIQNVSSETSYVATGYLLSSIFGLLMVIIVFLASCICTIIISAMALSRSMQIILNAAFAPIAFADSYKDGFINSKAWKFIQKYIALNLQAGLILAVATIAPMVGNSIANSIAMDMAGLTGIMTLLASIVAQFSAVALASKTNQVANDIVGI